MRNQRYRTTKLDPLVKESSRNNNDLAMLNSSLDKMSNTMQKSIYGMLSDLKRAKNMRKANELMKEQEMSKDLINLQQN